MVNKPFKMSVTLSLDSDVLEELRELAAYEDRPVSQYVNLLLRKFLAMRKKGVKK